MSNEEQCSNADPYAPGGYIFGTDGTDKIVVRIGRHERIFSKDLLRLWAASGEERNEGEVS